MPTADKKTVIVALGGAAVAFGIYLYFRKKGRSSEEIKMHVKRALKGKGMIPNKMSIVSLERKQSAGHLLSSRQRKMQDLDESFFETLDQSKLKINRVKICKIDNIRDYIPGLKWRENHYARARTMRISKTSERNFGAYTRDDDVVLFDIIRGDKSGTDAMAFKRAGCRKMICWKGSEVKAAIITCGGLCPGLNVVINEIVEVLYFEYGVNSIYGVKGGYRGLVDGGYGLIELNPTVVKGINRKGGTILWSSRGGISPASPPEEIEKILNKLESYGINMLYIIGGDGTHRGAYRLYQHAKAREKKMIIAGIPKTIDNDMGVIDSSFGFNSAVEQATKAIFSAVTEATCNKPNGVGIVKLMGRHAGYIACHATLASRQVDMCLINEDPFLETNGPEAMAEYIEKTVQDKGHAVIVVAEGAGNNFLKSLRSGMESVEKDAGGNEALSNICDYLIDYLKQHFKQRSKACTVKFIDPSYMIRSVAANASDNVMCLVLAQNAVHGAMAGYTGFTSGLVNNRSVMIPMPVIMATSPSFLNPRGRTWSRVLAATQQPVTMGLHD